MYPLWPLHYASEAITSPIGACLTLVPGCGPIFPHEQDRRRQIILMSGNKMRVRTWAVLVDLILRGGGSPPHAR